MKPVQFTFQQFVFVFLLSTGLLNHVIVIPFILNVAGRDSWMSTLVAFGFVLVVSVMVFYISKVTGQVHIITWLKKSVHPVFANLFLIMICLYLFGVSYFTLKDTVFFTTNTYLSGTPNFVIMMTLLVTCFYNSYHGLSSIVKNSGILLPFVVLLGFFISITTIPSKEYVNLRPFLENGLTPVFHGAIYVSAALMEVFLLIFIHHRLKNKIKLRSIFFLVFFLMGLTIGPLIGAITLFGNEEATVLRYPAYEEWRLLNFGVYIENVDFFAIYQWLAGAFIRISFTMCLIAELAMPVSSKQKRGRLTGGLFIALFLVLLIPINDPTFLKLLYDWIIPGIFFYSLAVISLLFLICLIYSFRKSRKNQSKGGGPNVFQNN